MLPTPSPMLPTAATWSAQSARPRPSTVFVGVLGDGRCVLWLPVLGGVTRG